MKPILQEINAIEHVLGSFLFNENLFFEKMPEIYRSLLPEITSSLLRSFAPQRAEQDDWLLNELCVRFTGGFLFLRRVNSLYLAVLCSPDIKIPFLKVALNVAKMKIAQWKEDLTPPPPMLSPSLSSLPSHLPAPLALHKEPPSGGWTLSSGSHLPPDAIPPDALGEPLVKQITRTLASFLGPVAKILMKKSLQHLGVFAKTITRSQRGALLRLLSKEIDDPSERQRFLDLCSAITDSESAHPL